MIDDIRHHNVSLKIPNIRATLVAKMIECGQVGIMRQSFSVCVECFRFAWNGSFSAANSWGTLLGAVVIWLVVRFYRIKDLTIPGGSSGLLFSALICLIAAWLVIFISKLLYSPLYLITQRDRIINVNKNEIEDLRRQSGDTFSNPNTIYNAIEISFYPVEPFTRLTKFSAGNARFELYVKIKNIGDGFLSECLVSVSDISPMPQGYNHGILRLVGTLAKGEHSYVLIAGFNEIPTQPTGPFNDLITFAFATGGFFAGWVTIKAPSNDNAVLITIEAKALECGSQQKKFRMWVTDNRRILMEAI